MPEDLPWRHYRKDRLRSGMSYPVGRDLVEASLRAAGAAVGTLVFMVPASGGYSPQRQNLVEVFWFGDAKSRYLSNALRTPADSLLMRVWAVPSNRRRDIAGLLAEAIPGACRWATAASTRGGAWFGTDHLLTVRLEHDAMLTETT